MNNRRDFLHDSLLGAAAASALPSVPTYFFPQGDPVRPERGQTDPIRIAVIGVRGRGRSHVGAFKKSKDSEVVAICDADEAVIGGAMKAVPKAKYYKDIRKMLEDKSIDAVSIATPNHWHSLATYWALQAGKHVYVEKPISHNVAEGRAVVDLAAKSGLVVAHGTQARTQPATREAIEWLREGGLGRVEIARALCYKRRKSIGKIDKSTPIPKSMDFDLWTGPAAMLPVGRAKIHYDWHWVFNTGNGDLGNQGVHQMDIARWGLAQDSLPTAVVSSGGRLGYDDDGDTPNTMVSTYDYGDQKLVFEVRGLVTGGYRKTHIGVIFHCAEGYLVSASYGKVLAFDPDGKQVKMFRGTANHFQNFLDAVKKGDPNAVNAGALDGHLSSALCHMGNISYRVGSPQTHRVPKFGDCIVADESFRRMTKHLESNKVDMEKATYTIGPKLKFDPATERFVGELAAAANALTTRPNRGSYTFS